MGSFYVYYNGNSISFINGWKNYFDFYCNWAYNMDTSWFRMGVSNEKILFEKEIKIINQFDTYVRYSNQKMNPILSRHKEKIKSQIREK